MFTKNIENVVYRVKKRANFNGSCCFFIEHLQTKITVGKLKIKNLLPGKLDRFA